jgi:hypothetical protein
MTFLLRVQLSQCREPDGALAIAAKARLIAPRQRAPAVATVRFGDRNMAENVGVGDVLQVLLGALKNGLERILILAATLARRCRQDELLFGPRRSEEDHGVGHCWHHASTLPAARQAQNVLSGAAI